MKPGYNLGPWWPLPIFAFPVVRTLPGTAPSCPTPVSKWQMGRQSPQAKVWTIANQPWNRGVSSLYTWPLLPLHAIPISMPAPALAQAMPSSGESLSL